jgi:hypothetical protein
MLTVNFPKIWVNAGKFEAALRSCPSPHESGDSEITFFFPLGCKIMIDAALRLLSLVNQLDLCGKRVCLYFEEGQSGAEGYLNRAGFFDHLLPSVEVYPERPAFSGARAYQGFNKGLVEIAKINREERDQNLPTRLVEAIAGACQLREDVAELTGAAWTIFAELIDNIFSHSQTALDGLAALQVYSKGSGLKVAVSDSGIGILETLRPTLKQENPRLERLSDIDLLVELFRQGISRHGADRGCGLKGAAGKAMKFKADLDLRLPKLRVLLTPGVAGYRPNTAYCYEDLPLVWGTHLSFSLKLDNPG